MRKVKAIVRPDSLQRVIEALKEANVPRLYLYHLHALGAGVDPEQYRVSAEEGEVYTEKVALEFLCTPDRVEELVELVRVSALTGKRGDGLIIVSDLSDVINIRTGDHDRVALL